jgi:nucleoside-diphosphate-sugar epimerase
MKRIFITGSSSRLGSAICEQLQSDYKLSLLIHKNPVSFQDAEQLPGGLEALQSHRHAIQSAELIVHLAGATHQDSLSSYLQVNRDGTERLLSVCSPKQPILYMSTRCIGKEGGAYSYSKQLAEDAIVSSARPYVILRPSEVYGSKAGEGIDSLLNIAKRTRLLIDFQWNPPVTYSPVSLDELANITVQIIRNFQNEQAIYTVCNDESYTSKDIQTALSDYLKKTIFRLPVPVKALQQLQKLRAPLPFKPDQLQRLIMNKSSDNSLVKEKYGFQPLSFTKAIRAGKAIMDSV